MILLLNNLKDSTMFFAYEANLLAYIIIPLAKTTEAKCSIFSFFNPKPNTNPMED
jgi:hypothetical protein